MASSFRRSLFILPAALSRAACFLLTLTILAYSNEAQAAHVKGGYIQYKYNGVGSSSNTSNYTITVTVFFSCTVAGPRASVYLGVFNASTDALVASKSISTTTSTTVTKTTYSPCMSDPPSICYEIYTYVYTVDLANISAGYILAVQDAYRTDGIINISNSSSDGITINANIPGTINGTDYHTNSSPSFAFNDTAIICYNGNFSYLFSATDLVDGDSFELFIRRRPQRFQRQRQHFLRRAGQPTLFLPDLCVRLQRHKPPGERGDHQSGNGAYLGHSAVDDGGIRGRRIRVGMAKGGTDRFSKKRTPDLCVRL